MADVSARTFFPTSIKSVQHGNVTLPSSIGNTDVTISTVDPDRSLVTSRADDRIQVYVLNATTLRIYNPTTAGFTVQWQVVEFY